MEHLNDYQMFFSFKKTWAFNRFINCPESLIALFTGNQYGKCLTYQSLISTASGDVPVGKLYDQGEPFSVYAWDGNKKVVSQAKAPIKKDKKEPCVRVHMDNGKWFEAALGHRVLTDQGYFYIADLLYSNHTRLSSSPQYLQASNSEPCQLVHGASGLRCARKGQDCPADCSTDFRQYDEQPLSCRDSGQVYVPSQGGVLQHNSISFCLDALASGYTYTRRLLSRRLSNLDAGLRYVGRFFGSLFCVPCTSFQLYSHALPSFVPLSIAETSSPLLRIGDRQPQYELSSYKPPSLINGNHIISYEFIGCNDVYDFEVPIYHNYFAADVVHHNTGGTAYQYVMRVLGVHPVAKKNVVYFECENRAKLQEYSDDDVKYQIEKAKYLEQHETLDSGTFTVLKNPDICPDCGGKIVEHRRGSRVFRFASENLPGQAANLNEHGLSAEVKNTQYPEFKKWLPKFLIKKDITIRSPSMIVTDPYGGPDIIVEFISYNQTVQSTAGTQRLSVWYDEEPDPNFREEQIPRLLAEDGDEILTLTPASHITWTYDEIYEQATVLYRTKAICEFLKADDYTPKQIERTGRKGSIAVIQAATDDNPTLNKDVIDAMFEKVDDPDILAIRRYGIFKQVSGRIFKDFEYPVHYVNKDKYFPNGIPHGWVHARGIDYHQQTPWACGFISLSDNDEAFVWQEYNPSPEKYTTNEIAEHLAMMSKDYKFTLNLIDPLAKIAKNSITIVDDLNAKFRECKQEGIGTGGFWMPWDTKGEKGRDEIQKRLKNSKLVGKPFNNTVIREGRRVNLPTLWILDSCPLTAKSVRQWRWEEYAEPKMRQIKGDKNKPEQRWSHFPMVLEACFKHPLFRPKSRSQRQERIEQRYFKAR